MMSVIIDKLFKAREKELIEKFIAKLRIIQVIDFERMDQWKTIEHQFIEPLEAKLKE